MIKSKPRSLFVIAQIMGIMTLISPFVMGMDEANIDAKPVGNFQQIGYHPLDQRNFETSCQQMQLVFNAMKEIGIETLEAVGTETEIILFIKLPADFVRFVSSVEEIPSDMKRDPMTGDLEDSPNFSYCDFVKKFPYSEDKKFFSQRISTGALRSYFFYLDCVGYKEGEKQQILLSPTYSVISLFLLQRDYIKTGEQLTTFLKKEIIEKIKYGIYISVPENTELVDWHQDQNCYLSFNEYLKNEKRGRIKYKRG